jgi:two-component system chemotaxis sensor kinase CheA
VAPGDLRAVEGREVVFVDGAAVPVVSLSGALGLPGAAEARGDASGRLTAVVVASGGVEAAFVVDELLAEQEIVVKGLGRRVPRVPSVTGAAVLPSGRIALILGAAEILHAALFRSLGGAALVSPLFELTPSPAQASRRRLLIADDSITTRSLEKTILESAGYEVIAAADGVEALRLLEENEVDLVVSDVDMPRMDGFALTEAIRASPRLRDLPVILLSARGTDADKARGAEAGADAYLVKSAFEQKSLLEAITQLI